MFTKAILAILLACGLTNGQTPAPSLPPNPSPEKEAAVNSLAPAEIDEAIKLLKSNLIDATVVKDQEINRATLDGLLTRSHGGAELLAAKPHDDAVTTLYSDIISNHIGYIRLGAMTRENLGALDQALSNFAAKKVDALIIDLRASASPNDFDTGAEMTKRLVNKGAPLWTLHKPVAHQEHAFTNERDPSFRGLIIALIDAETAGPAEAIAAALKVDAQALLIGETSAGRAVEYADFPLTSGKILRVATAEASAPNGQLLFPGGVKPDLPVDFSSKQKHQIFGQSVQRGMAPFVFEAERPHFNEAALISGINPELEARQPKRNEDLHDPVLQRAVDVVVSLGIFQKH